MTGAGERWGERGEAGVGASSVALPTGLLDYVACNFDIWLFVQCILGYHNI